MAAAVTAATGTPWRGAIELDEDAAEVPRGLMERSCSPSVGSVEGLPVSAAALWRPVSVGEGERREEMDEMVMSS